MNLQRFVGKSVIVTGGSSGIGKATAERFASEGANVLIFADRAEEVRATAEAMRSAGHSVIDCHGDVANSADVQRAVQMSIEHFGGVDVLVGNAGIATSEPFVHISEERWDRLMDINLKGMFLFAQASARQMLKQNTGGALLFTASVNGLAAETGLASYNASKAAIILMMKTIALELGPYRIRANAVCPGLIHTPLTNSFVNNGEAWNNYVRTIAWGRAGAPEEVAAAFAFLASDDAVYITGETINVDGGQMANLSLPALMEGLNG